VETIDGRDVLVNPTGHPVVGVSSLGVAIAAHSLDPPTSERSARRAARVLPANAASIAAGAQAKSAFLAAVQELGRAAGIGGAFKPQPARARTWNVTSTDPDLASGTGNQ
jgi:hypothetical protein